MLTLKLRQAGLSASREGEEFIENPSPCPLPLRKEGGKKFERGLAPPLAAHAPVGGEEKGYGFWPAPE